MRYGIRRADDPLIVDSLKVVDAVLKIELPYGPCWRRYNHDGYGDSADGGPFEGWGQGRAWPLLTGERAHYELAAGQRYHAADPAIREDSPPEADAARAGMGLRRPSRQRACHFGRPAGSAQPLVWAHAEYLKLLRSATDGKVFDRISVSTSAIASPKAGSAFTSNLEIYTSRRPIQRVPAGYTLRIVDADRFRLVWTIDDWSRPHHTRLPRTGQPASSPTS